MTNTGATALAHRLPIDRRTPVQVVISGRGTGMTDGSAEED